MGKKGKQVLTQIVFQSDDPYVVGWIACCSNVKNARYNYLWSVDGAKWSTKHHGYTKAIELLLEDTGHKKSDAAYIIPWPEIYKKHWLDSGDSK